LPIVLNEPTLGTDHSTCQKFIGSLNAASQSNLEVIASGDMDDKVRCPPEYTNVISDTNLFTPAGHAVLQTNDGIK
jgi:hypothetical protein